MLNNGNNKAGRQLTIVNLTNWAAGRNELDDSQEINYKPIMEEIARTGYTGYVGQEFIPTRDPLKSLTEAVLLCDV
jgi:hydroxypyruvate isomerase